MGGWSLPARGEGHVLSSGQVVPMLLLKGEMVMVFPLGKLVLVTPHWGRGWDCMITPRWGRGWVKWLWSSHWKLGLWVNPTGGEGGLHAYSPLGERVGEMVIVFLLGKLVLVTPRWGRGWSCMITPRWGRGWVKWLWCFHWGTWFMDTPHWGRGWVACLFPAEGEGGRNGYCLPAGEVGFGYSPLGERVGLHDYSSLGERVGKMVMVFPLGNLVYGYSPLGERVGCMLIPRWGRGWAKWLLSSRWGSWFMVSPRWGDVGVA